jgi:hypothetical protein
MDLMTRLRVLGRMVTGYAATPAARTALASARREHGAWVFQPSTPARTGILIFPGARVELAAYAPLAADLAQDGVLAVLVPVPGGMALIGQGPAMQVVDAHPEIERWAAAGHSLGSTGAARLVHRHRDRFQALVMLAGYSAPADDLSDWSGQVLSIRATNDAILNPPRYAAGLARLPATLVEVEVPGNHAGFGDYGPQVADGPALPDPSVQRAAIRKAIGQLLAH